MLLGIIASLFLSAAPVASSAPNYSVPILDLEGDTVASAALLSPTHALTAAHAVEGLYEPVFMRCGKELMFGIVTKFDAAADLAVVDTLIPCNSVTVLAIASTNPDEGTRIVVQGYPAGGPRRTTSGVVSGYDKITFEDRSSKPRPVMISDVLIAGGNSGGPAVANNVLVGIVQAKICFGTPRGLVPACYSILAPPSLIRSFLGQDS
jgi:S1-C subfamily serine protease